MRTRQAPGLALAGTGVRRQQEDTTWPHLSFQDDKRYLHPNGGEVGGPVCEVPSVTAGASVPATADGGAGGTEHHNLCTTSLGMTQRGVECWENTSFKKPTWQVEMAFRKRTIKKNKLEKKLHFCALCRTQKPGLRAHLQRPTEISHKWGESDH